MAYLRLLELYHLRSPGWNLPRKIMIRGYSLQNDESEYTYAYLEARTFAPFWPFSRTDSNPKLTVYRMVIVLLLKLYGFFENTERSAALVSQQDC